MLRIVAGTQLVNRRLALVLAVVAAGSLLLAVGKPHARKRQLRVGLVGIEVLPGERSLESNIYDGFRRAVKQYGAAGRVLSVAPTQDARAALASLARQKYDLIIAGLAPPQSVASVATRFRDSTFLVFDFPHELLPRRPKNVLSVVFRVEEASYLAGQLAALMETRRAGRDVISSVGGVKIPPVDAFIAGYQAGAKKANPTIVTLNNYASTFGDPRKCKTVALGQIARGSHVIFQVAGGCGLGALEAAKENRVWGIGVDVDESYLGPHILTSVVNRYDEAIVRTVADLVRGQLRTGRTQALGLRDGAVALGKISARVPRSFVRAVERTRAQVLARKIIVPATLP